MVLSNASASADVKEEDAAADEDERLHSFEAAIVRRPTARIIMDFSVTLCMKDRSLTALE